MLRGGQRFTRPISLTSGGSAVCKVVGDNGVPGGQTCLVFKEGNCGSGVGRH